MANKISELDPATTPLAGTELAWVEQGGNPRRVPVSEFGGSESDPVFQASPAFNITNTLISNWNAAYGWGDWSASIATDTNLRAGVSGKLVDAAGIYSANAPVTSSGSGSWAPDLKSGRNLLRTLTGNSTLANPTDVVAGQSGLLIIKQDGTGGRTLAIESNWKTPDGEAPEIDTTASARNLFSYYAESATEILLDYKGVYA